MTVALDVSPLLVRSAGVKNYLYYWARSLAAARGAHRLRYVPLTPDWAALDHQHRHYLGIALTLLHPTRGLRGANLFHVAALRPPRRIPFSATLHDLSCWDVPELHLPATVRAAHALSQTVWKPAAGLIAVSEHTRRRAIERLGIPPSRIRTIHSGVPGAYFDQQPTRPGRHLLFVSTLEPRKNVGLLLDAYSDLPAEHKRECPLLLAGGFGWRSDALRARLSRPIAGVRHLGYVPEARLPALTAQARALVYPSLYEGFGFPVAQAMAAGVAVVASNNTCLPEIAGDAALLIDSRSRAAWTAALRRLIESPDLAAELGDRGRRLAHQRYRWELAARASWDFFETLAG